MHLAVALALVAAAVAQTQYLPFAQFNPQGYLLPNQTLIVRGAGTEGIGFNQKTEIVDDYGFPVLTLEIVYKKLTITHTPYPIYDPANPGSAQPANIVKVINRTDSVFKEFNLRVRPIAPDNCGFVVYENWRRHVFPCPFTPARDYSNKLIGLNLYCNNNCTYSSLQTLPQTLLPYAQPLPNNNLYTPNVTNAVVLTAATLGDWSLIIANDNFPTDINFQLSIIRDPAFPFQTRKVFLNSLKNGVWGTAVNTGIAVPVNDLWNFAIQWTEDGIVVRAKPLYTAVVQSATYPHQATHPLFGYKNLVIEGALEPHNLHIENLE